MFICCLFRSHTYQQLTSERRPLRPRRRQDFSIQGTTPACSHTNIDGYTSDNKSDTENLPGGLLNSKQPQGRSSGLVDGLSKFFTPSDKRRSRVSFVSRSFGGVDDWRGSFFDYSQLTRRHSTQSHSQQAATRLIRKSKKLKASKSKVGRPLGSGKGRVVRPHGSGRNGRGDVITRQRQESEASAKPKIRVGNPAGSHTGRAGRPRGSSQVKCLFDGLSHLFAAQGERKRSFGVWMPSSRYMKMDAESTSSEGNTTGLISHERVSPRLKGPTRNWSFLRGQRRSHSDSPRSRHGWKGSGESYTQCMSPGYNKKLDMGKMEQIKKQDHHSESVLKQEKGRQASTERVVARHRRGVFSRGRPPLWRYGRGRKSMIGRGHRGREIVRCQARLIHAPRGRCGYASARPKCTPLSYGCRRGRRRHSVSPQGKN